MNSHSPTASAANASGSLQTALSLLAVDFGTLPAQRGGIVAHFHRYGHVSLTEIVAILKETGLHIVESGAVGISDLQYVLAVAPCSD